MSKENILEINNLMVGFRRENAKDAEEDASGDLIAVRGVSLSLAKGETLALVGESGCGKTVLCKSVLKLLCEKGRIHGGEIYFEGKDLVPLSERDMRQLRGSGIAMVFQDPATALDPAFSVGEQIEEVLRCHKGMSRKAAAERAMMVMKKVQIPDAEVRYQQRPYQFSGGMRQRAAIAMALAGEPMLLIADEPTTALDEETQREILKLLKEVQLDTGAAMLFITHDLGIVGEMAEQVAIMKDGIIVEKGTVAEVFAAPKHEYTRELVEHMECRRGKGRGDNGRTCGQPDSVPLLSVDNLNKSFFVGRSGKVQVLKDFSMGLHAGEIVGIVGPSGCGKTTLARCIMGIERTDAGKIFIGAENRGQTTCIQMIFQDSSTAFNDRMTVQKIVGEPLIIAGKLSKKKKTQREGMDRGMPKQYSIDDLEKKVRSVMQAVDLDHETFAERKPYELSGGQRQRVAIARALITDPDIIIADEPLTGLDVSAQAQIAALFRKLADERGLAVLFIAHDRRMVEIISDRVIEMESPAVYRATES